MTNSEKFKEVFGFIPNDTLECIVPHEVCDTVGGVCFECPFGDFWNREYRECFTLDMEKVKALAKAKKEKG